MVIISLVIYSIGYNYQYGYYDFYSFSNCLIASIKAFGFEIKEEYVKSLAEVDVIYKIDVFMATIISGLSLLSSLLYFIKSVFTNSARFLWRLILKSPDLVIGNNKQSIEFAKRDKHCIILIDNNFTPEFGKAEKEELALLKIPYFKLKLTAKNLRKLLSLTRGKVNVFIFEPEADKIQMTIKLIEEMSVYLKNIHKKQMNI